MEQEIIIPLWTRKMYSEAGIAEDEMMTHEKKIYEDYPATKMEKRGCVSEKVKMEGKRNERRKRLIAVRKEKVVVPTEVP